MEKKIVKAELLWTYACQLRCSGCNMVKSGPSKKWNTMTESEWDRGFSNLAELGCEFVAIYGAEPLLEFEKLPEAVSSIRNQGMDCTLITNCMTPNVREKLTVLNAYGLDSLTASYDPVPYDLSSKAKSDRSIATLEWFKSLFEPRDVAAVVTVTEQSLDHLAATAEYLSDKGIWMFCDLMHWDKGNPGTKCSGARNATIPHTYQKVVSVYEKLIKMKGEGFLVHANEAVLDVLKDDYLGYNWMCTNDECFPSWVTIDPNGNVHPCDDLKFVGVNVFNVQNLQDHWEQFARTARSLVRTRCKGCAWCTHIQAAAIKSGKMDVNDYVHGRD